MKLINKTASAVWQFSNKIKYYTSNGYMNNRRS